MEEQVVLVDDTNQPIGTLPKSVVHHHSTPLHRGFSLFLFRANRDLLLQQRSQAKKTFPGVWSNSCCGHPQPDEPTVEAAKRRAADELGLNLKEVHEILPHYRYRAQMNGIVENEICPVLVAFTDETPRVNPDEVAAIRWLPWIEWLGEVQKNPHSYSPWCVEETELLETNEEFRKIYTER